MQLLVLVLCLTCLKPSQSQYEYGYHTDPVRNTNYLHNSCELFSNGTIQIMSVAKFDKSPIAQAMTHELELIPIQFRNQQLWLSFNNNNKNIIHPFWAHFRAKFSDMILESDNQSEHIISPSAGSYFDPLYGRVIVIPGLQTFYRNPSINSVVGLHFVVGKEAELFPAKPEETILRPLKDNEIRLVLMNFVDLSEKLGSKTVLYALRTVRNSNSLMHSDHRIQITDVELDNGTLLERNVRFICMKKDNMTLSLFTYYDPWESRNVNQTNISTLTCEEFDIDFGYIYLGNTYLVSYSAKTAYIINYNWLLSDIGHSVIQVPLGDFLGCKSSTIAAMTTFLPLAVFIMIVLFCCCVCCSFISENQDGFLTISE